jgi:hypothetical protein
VVTTEVLVEPLAPEPVARNRSGHRVGWVSAMVGAGVVVGLLIVAFLKFVDGPTEGKVSDNALYKARAAAAVKPPAPNLLSGLMIEFQYPSIFDAVAQVRTVTHATEQYNISSKSSAGRSIVVIVQPSPAGTLADDSSYRLRQIQSSTYTPTTEKINGEPVALMTKVGGQEQTLFWIHKGNEVTVSITSTNPKDSVPEIMALIKKTLRWRQ